MHQHTAVAKLWLRLGNTGLGRWLFSRIVCWKAPYFSSVSPNITHLEMGLCKGTIQQRRRIQNHIGTIHAIALCNLAELCAGIMTDVSIPPSMRWIPRGMSVSYLQKAQGTVSASARPKTPFHEAATGYDGVVEVLVTDQQQQLVFSADIAMWISPKRQGG